MSRIVESFTHKSGLRHRHPLKQLLQPDGIGVKIARNVPQSHDPGKRPDGMMEGNGTRQNLMESCGIFKEYFLIL